MSSIVEYCGCDNKLNIWIYMCENCNDYNNYTE